MSKHRAKLRWLPGEQAHELTCDDCDRHVIFGGPRYDVLNTGDIEADHSCSTHPGLSLTGNVGAREPDTIH